MSTLSIRIKQARLQAALSQEQLGILAGLDPSSASARMNRYELGKRVPTPAFIERLALELGLTPAFFYSADSDESELLTLYHRLDEAGRRAVMAAAREASDHRHATRRARSSHRPDQR